MVDDKRINETIDLITYHLHQVVNILFKLKQDLKENSKNEKTE